MLFTPYSQTSSRLSRLGSCLPPFAPLAFFCGYFPIPGPFPIRANGAFVPLALDALFLAPIVFMNNFTEQHGQSTTKEETRQSRTDTDQVGCYSWPKFRDKG